jgi:hypothetical protein
MGSKETGKAEKKDKENQEPTRKPTPPPPRRGCC